MATINGLSGLSTNAHLSCAANSNSTAANALSSPTQRASKKAATSSELREKFTKDESDLAGVDVVLLQLREYLAAEGGAMGAGQRAVFDHRHARGVADHQLRQRSRLETRS